MRTATPSIALDGMPLSDTSIRRPVGVTVLGFLAIVIGLLAYSSLPVDYLPNVPIATVSVSLRYRNAAPQVMIDQVARPIEDQLTTISGIKHLTTVANEGTVQLVVEFQDGVQPDVALQHVRDKVNAALPELPANVATPVFQQVDPNDSPILQLAITSEDGMTPLQLRSLIDTVFTPAIEQVGGVGAVNVSGGQTRQVNVWLDLEALQARSLAAGQVANAIAKANVNLGLGTISMGSQNIALRAPSAVADPAALASLRIPGTPYRVGDVARVEDGVAEVESYARLDGRDAVTMAIRKQSGSNTVQVASGAHAAIDALLAEHPQLRAAVTSDQSTQVSAAVSSSIEETILAVVAAMLVVLLFFRDLRNTLVTVAGLPIIIIATFAAIWAFGLTVNIITLLALSLSVGLVIDDAIVVRENIFRHLEHGENPLRAASRATAQVASSVLAMSLTIIAVFLPTAFTSGTSGVLLRSFGVTVACAMAISLVEAFTWAPMLSAHLFHGEKQPPAAQKATQAASAPAQLDHEPLPDGRMEQIYQGALGWGLRHRWAVVGIAIAALAVSVGVAMSLRFAFLPAQQSDTFGIGFQLAPGASLDATDALARKAEAVIQADPEVASLQTLVGSTGTTSSGRSPESATFVVRVRDYHRAEAARERLRGQLAFLPGLSFSAQNYRGGTNTAATNRNVQAHIQSSRSLEDLNGIAQQVAAQMQQVPGFIDIGSSYNLGRPEIKMTLDTDAARQHGLTNTQVASAVQTLINGSVATTLQQGGQNTDVVVQTPAERRADLGVLQQISLDTPKGPVPLGAVAVLTSGVGSTSLRRYDRQNEIVIGANVAPGQDQNALQRQLREQLPALGLPPDVAVRFGGQSENQREGFQSMLLAMAFAVLFVYVVLAAQFESFSQPLVIMLAMPFSFLGAFLALRIGGLTLDITAMIGLIMLLGLVVKNSILLVDVANQQRRAGMALEQAIIYAGAIRLRPILMTSAAIIGGAMPTALGLHFLSSGQGSEFRKTLAVVLIGGMLTSTLLTLLVVPVAYSMLDSLQRRFARRPAQVAPPASAELHPQHTEQITPEKYKEHTA